MKSQRNPTLLFQSCSKISLKVNFFRRNIDLTKAPIYFIPTGIITLINPSTMILTLYTIQNKIFSSESRNIAKKREKLISPNHFGCYSLFGSHFGNYDSYNVQDYENWKPINSPFVNYFYRVSVGLKKIVLN